MPARWTAEPYSVAAADALSRELGLSPATASILVRRGYDTPRSARAFLAADERHEPGGFAGIDAACAAILRQVEGGGRIVVHGDYDVDGAASTAILVLTLRALGADPRWHLPSRSDEGYGLSAATVERLAAEGTDLLITADCGITAADEVDRARALGLEVVVSDHHRPGERLPACPIIHPAVCGYPFADLCAAGVAHKLSEALYAAAGDDPARAEEDLDLVALATVADVVPLRGENRRLVRAGLGALARTRRPGLRALMRVAALDPGDLSAQTVAFRLAPRLNAAGRLQRADAALELLLTEDDARAAEVADELDLLNRERRDTETRILFAAEAARAEQADAPAYVLAGEGWHHGVIGIVASRMVERHHRPCLMVALGPEGGRGSGRTIGAFDLHAALAACARHLRRFGGHRAAAGFELDPDALEEFRHAFVRHAASVLSPDDLAPVERIDAVVPGAALGLALAEELERLEPFGCGNPEPTLLVPAATVADVRPMGAEGQHCRLTLASGGARARAVAFRTSAKSLAAAGGEPQDLAGRLELDHWNGTVEPRFVLRVACPTETGGCRLIDDDQDFWMAVERLLAKPARAPGHPRQEAVPHEEPGRRALRDRRGEGLAGLAGELLSSGEPVLIVCADARHRRAGIERLIGGLGRAAGMPSRGDATSLGHDLAGPAPIALASWDALASDPDIASAYLQLLALDPPTVPAGEWLLRTAPATAGEAFAHLGWGLPEVEFAAAVAHARLDLRPALATLYRALRGRGLVAGDALEAVLRGESGAPRPASLCARLVRVLVELDLASYEPRAAGGPSCRLLEGAPRTALERSATWRACIDQLAEVAQYLSVEAATLKGGHALSMPVA